MKLTRHIFIYTLLLCVTVQGTAISSICLGPDHTDSTIDWASNCHSHSDGHADPHETAFGEKKSNCIDISIISIAGSGSCFRPDDQLSLTKPILLKSGSSENPLSLPDFSRLRTTLMPVFMHMVPLSIESTILII